MFKKNHTSETKTAIAASRKNSRWVHEPKSGTTKSIKKELLEQYLAVGWKPGKYSDKRWMFDPITREQRQIPKSQVEKHLQLGWKCGRLKYQKDPDFLLSF